MGRRRLRRRLLHCNILHPRSVPSDSPLRLAAGIGFGLAFGFCAAAPASEHAALRGGAWAGHVADMPATAHTLAVLAGALLAVFGGKEATLSGGGALAAIVLGATAARLWPAEACKPVRAHVNEAWGHLQPALFGLLGAVSADCCS